MLLFRIQIKFAYVSTVLCAKLQPQILAFQIDFETSLNTRRSRRAFLPDCECPTHPTRQRCRPPRPAPAAVWASSGRKAPTRRTGRKTARLSRTTEAAGSPRRHTPLPSTRGSPSRRSSATRTPAKKYPQRGRCTCGKRTTPTSSCIYE